MSIANASPAAAPEIVKSTSTRLFHGQRWRAVTPVIVMAASAARAANAAAMIVSFFMAVSLSVI